MFVSESATQSCHYYRFAEVISHFFFFLIALLSLFRSGDRDEQLLCGGGHAQ
jgi:hypothetical protein